MTAFVLKKSFISKLEIINTVASVGIANITRVRIAMASPIEAKQDFFSALVIYTIQIPIFLEMWEIGHLL